MVTTLSPLTAVVEIPLDLIDPSPANPRHVITGAMVDALAENLRLEGQKTPAKVRPKGDGRYKLFAGHIRRLAALKAGIPSLKCLVLEITPEQAFLEAVLDNRGQQMSWLDDYLVVERMGVLFPGMKQPEMAARLQLNQSTVSRAQKIVGLLNQASRDLIYAQCIDSTPYQVSFRVMAALAGLATGSAEDPSRVEAALRVAVDRRLKEKDALKLANWVKGGNKPEDFPQRGAGGQPQVGQPSAEAEAASANDSSLGHKDPYAPYWGTLEPEIKVKATGKGYRIQMTLEGSEAPLAAFAASKALQEYRGHSAGSPPAPGSLGVGGPSRPPSSVQNIKGVLHKGFLGVLGDLGGSISLSGVKMAWQNGSEAVRNPKGFRDSLLGRQGRYAQVGYWAYALALGWVVFKVIAFVWGLLGV
jgi:ParB family chromosome partitioning protein